MRNAVRNIAKYEQVVDLVRRRVRGPDWRTGARLPSQRALAAEYGVNLSTVNKALSILISEGLLRQEHGKGTYLAGAAETPTLPVAFVTEVQPRLWSEHVYYSELIAGLSEATNAAGYGFQLFSAGDGAGGVPESPLHANAVLSESLERGAFSGLLLMVGDERPYWRELAGFGLPFACLSDHAAESRRPACVGFDRRRIGLAAGDYLVRQGCRSIGLTAAPCPAFLAGLQEACRAATGDVSIRLFASLPEAVAGADGVFLMNDYSVLDHTDFLATLPSVERLVVFANAHLRFPRELPRLNLDSGKVVKALWATLHAQLAGRDPAPPAVLIPPEPILLPESIRKLETSP